MWASLIIGLVVGLISSVVSWSIQKYQPLWTSTAAHDITYTHGVPGILGAVAGKTTLARDRSHKCVFKSIRFHLNKNEAMFFSMPALSFCFPLPSLICFHLKMHNFCMFLPIIPTEMPNKRSVFKTMHFQKNPLFQPFPKASQISSAFSVVLV